MKIKIMYPNNRGNIELKKEELEQLLNESYSEGYSDGSKSHGYTLYGYQDNSISSSPKITCNGDIVYTSTSAVANTELSNSTTSVNSNWVSGKTETIEISNVAGIGVVKTNEV